MQKKILASLLTVPMAYSAFAQIDVVVPVSKDAWTVNGLVGDYLKVEGETVETTGAVSAGWIKQTLTNLPVANYTLAFTEVANVTVTFTDAAGKDTTLVFDENNKSQNFKIATAGDVVLTIAPTVQSENFKFTGLNLDIDFDLKKYDDTLTGILVGKLYGDYFVAVDPAALAAEFECVVAGKTYNAVALDQEEKDMKAEIGEGDKPAETSVRGMIKEMRTIGDASTTFEQKVAIYNKYNFAAGLEENNIAKAMDALIAQLGVHNTNVKNLNQYWSNYNDNLANLAESLHNIATYQGNLDRIKDKIAAAANNDTYGDYAAYIPNATAAAVEAAQKAIDSEKAAIEKLFADDMYTTVHDVVDLDIVIEDAIDDVTTAFVAAEADVKAYCQWLNDTRDFLATYKNADTAIKAVEGIMDGETSYKTNFATLQAAALEEIENDYNNAVDQFLLKEVTDVSANSIIKGSAEKAPKDKAVMDQYTALINTVVSDLETYVGQKEEGKYVDGQNGYATEILDALAASTAELNKLVLPTVHEDAPETHACKQLAAKKAELAQKLSDIHDALIEAYVAAGKDKEDAIKEADVEAWKAEIAALDSDIAAFTELAAGISDLLKTLNTADGKVQAVAKAHKEVWGDLFYAKFQTAIDNITEAICSINLYEADGKTPYTITDKEKEDITNACTELVTNANNLSDAWIAAYTAKNLYESLQQELTEIIARKLFLAPGDKAAIVAKIASDAEALQAACEKYSEDYDNAELIENGQACYEAMLALAAEFNKEEVTTKYYTLDKTFDQDGSAANASFVAIKLAMLETYAEGEYKGKEDIDELITYLHTVLDTINGNLDEENAKEIAKYTHTAYNAIDVALSSLIDDPDGGICIEKVKQVIDQYKECQALYDTFTTKMEDLEKQIAYDNKYVAENSTPKADEFFQNEMVEITKQFTALQEALETAYNAYYDGEENMIAKFEDLSVDYANIMHEATMIPVRVANNETGNLALLSLSNKVRTQINVEIDRLKGLVERANEHGATEIAAEIEGWIKDLNILLITSEEPLNLASVDQKENAAFAIGQVCLPDVDGYVNQYVAIENLYKAVQEKFNEMQAAYNAQYADDLAAWNNAFLGTQWQAYLDGLWDAYTFGVKTWELFMYGLENKGYKAFVEETVKTHKDIYDYIDKINSLSAEVDAYVKGKTDKLHFISEADFKAAAYDKVDTMEAEIEAKVETMETEVSTKAIEYNTKLHAEVVAYLAAEEAKLEAAGNVSDVEEETFAPNYADKTSAEELYTKYYQTLVDFEDGKATIGYQMDFVANYLDDALAAVDLEKAVQKQWSAYDIPAANKAMEAVDAIVANAPHATDAIKTANNAIIAEAKATIAELATKVATTATDNTIEDDVVLLKTLQDALNAAVKSAEDAAAAIKASSDANVADQEALKGWQADYATLNADLNDLKKFIDAIAAGYLAPVQDALAAAENALAAFKAGYESKIGNLVANATAIKALKDAVTTAIANAYNQAAYSENALLVDWTGKLKTAYNDAKVSTGAEDFDTTYAEIKDFIDGIAAEYPGSQVTAAKAPEYQEKAIDLEFNIATYYNTLQKLWTVDKNGSENPNPQPYTDALGNITTAEDACGIALNAAYEALMGYEALKEVNPTAFAAYEAQFQAYLAQYEAIQGAVAVEGVRVILNWEKFVNLYNALEAKIGTTGEAAQLDDQNAQDELAKRAASDARYDVLLAEYNDLLAAFQALKDKIEEYGIDDTAVNIQVEKIADQLDAALEDLNDKKDTWSLTENSTLKNQDAIASAIDFTALLAAKAYADKAVAEATAADKAVHEALKANIVPEIAKQISKEEAGLKEELEDVKNGIAAIDIADAAPADYEALHDQAARIAADLEALIAKAKENVYVLGDVTLDPDGVIDVNDVQLLIKWVGEGKTYADLYAMSPVIAAAANVAQEVGQDPVINIADVTAEINLAMNFDYDNVPTVAKYVQRKAAAQGSIALAALGNGRYAINLNSTQAFVAGQLDIALPAGCEIVSAQLAGMSHQLYQFNNDGYTRMIIASMSNEELKGDQLLIIEVEGNGAIAIDDAIFTDVNANAYALTNGTVTGIDSIETENGMTQRIYNAAGQAMRSIQRGINIIRHSDGTTTKELHK